MPLTLSFATVYSYDTGITGIEIPILLQSGPRTIELTAKVDTGASSCIFERIYGEKLGFDIESGSLQRINTVTGSFLTYGHEVMLIALGIKVTATVYFAADESFTRNVLGRQGWLDRIRLGLIDYDGQLYLSGYDDSPI
jgi:hypothetical protein